ncbi:MAG: fibronectin type III domain-containing protein [Minisyncoccota bacterium]
MSSVRAVAYGTTAFLIGFFSLGVIGVEPALGATAPTFVQSAASIADGTLTQAFPATNTAGNTIIVAVTLGNGTAITSANISDSQGNSYAIAGQTYDSGNNQSAAIAYALNIKGGSNTVTFTSPGSAGYTALAISEYSGIAASGALDGVASNIQNGTTAANAITSTAFTTSTAGDLIIGAFVDDAGGMAAISSGTGFTRRTFPTPSNSISIATEDQTQTTAGSVAATATFSLADRYLAIGAAFKPSSTSTPPPADTTAPTIPTGLTATVVSSSQINLSWSASTDNIGVTGYKIYRNGTQVATVASLSYANTGLTASTLYSYTVAAYDAAGNVSTQSGSVSATTQSGGTLDTTAPSIPTGLSASVISSSQINLAWSASTDNVGVTGYRIYRNGTLLTTTSATSYSNTGLAASTAYSYTVSAYDAAGNNSAQSTSVSATTQAAGTTTADADFQTRCTAVGVVLCNGLNTESDISAAVQTAGDGTRQVFIDTSDKVSGQGSAKFTLRSGVRDSNIGGALSFDLNHNFGTGQTIYVQYHWKAPSTYFSNNTNYWKSSIKQINIHGPSSTCQGSEFTTLLETGQQLDMYTNCGDGWFTDVNTNTRLTTCSADCLIQQGSSLTASPNGDGYNCHYQNQYAGIGDGSGCFWPVPDKWYTIYEKITLGTWGGSNTTVDAWESHDGLPMKQFQRVAGVTWNNNMDSFFSKIRLETYMTELSKTGSAAPVSSSVSYDELIVSTQPIAAPGTATPPPSTKFSLNDRVQVSSGPLNVRATASATGTLLGTQATGALGTVIGGPVSADGFNWWNINYDSGVDGWSAEDYLVKYTAPTPAPTITMSASPTSVTSGSSTTLTWFSTNATSCTASGGWTGTKATSGSQSLTNLTTTATYTLACTGAGGTATAGATVTVTSGGGGTPTTLGAVLLEDFSLGIRKNSANPPDDLFQSYLGADSSQTYGVSNGEFWNQGGPVDFYWHFFPPPYVWPWGFTQSYVESGSFNSTMDRMRFKFMCNVNMPRRTDGGGSFDIGTYVKQHGDTQTDFQGQHYYHTFNPNLYANQWAIIELNAHPQHRVGTTGDPGNDPEWNSPTTGAPVHYMDGLTRWYFGNPNNSALLNAKCYFDDFYFDTVTGAADDKVSSLVYTYSGSRYEVSWESLPNVNISYNVRYSTASMKVNGFSSGTDGGTVQNPGNDYLNTFWASPNMPQQTGGLYVAIQPVGNTNFTEVYIPNFSTSSTSAPTVTLSASPASVTSGSSSTLAWSSTNATSCTASGSWTGTKATSGSQTLTNLTTTGTYTLSCTGTGGTTTQSATITVTAAPDTTAPSTPTGLTATAISSSQINLSWSASTDPVVAGQITSGVSGYRIYRNGTQIATSPTASYSSTGLASGTTYSYTIAAVDVAGNVSAQSIAASATTQSVVTPDTTPPTVSLTAPTASVTVSGTVTVSASASDNIGVVGVQFKLDGANLGMEDTTSPYSTSWNTTSATNGTHTLTAVTRDAAGNTTTSSSVTVTVSNSTPDTTKPTIAILLPTTASTYATAIGTVTIIGTASDNVGVTQVTWSNSAGGSGTASGTTNWSTSPISLQSGTNAITVTAKDAAGNPGTDTITITYTPPTIDTIPPSTPANLSGSAPGTSEVDLSWAASTDNVGVTGYKIYRSGTQIATTNTPSYSDLNLSPFTTYTYTIAAYDAAGNDSPLSAQISVTTQSQAVAPPVTGGGGGGGGGGGSSVGSTGSSGGGTATGGSSGGGSFSANPIPAPHPSGLTSAQIQAILSLLSSFGADSTTVVNIGAILTGTAVPTNPSTPSTTPPSTLSIQHTLYFGLRSGEVTTLQQKLTQLGLFTIAPTGFYGLLTQKAVQLFQTKYGIVSSGSPLTTGYGSVGPKTRAKLNAF